MFWGRPPLRGGARQPVLPVECFTMSRLRPAGRRQPATINPPVPARKLWWCGAEAEIGEGEGKLSGESFPSPSPNPTPFPSKTFVNGAGGGLAARALLEVPRIRPPVPGISPDCAGWFRWLSGRPSASEFQPRSGIILICVCRSLHLEYSDASLFLGLPDVASCIRQQFVGVVSKGEWGRFSEPGISPDCAGWLWWLLARPSASEFQSPQRHHPDLRGRPPASGISDASLFLGLPDVASCIRQQFVGVVPKGEWGRFSEPGISPDCAGWLWWLLVRPSASEFQSPQRHHPDLRGPFPYIWNFRCKFVFGAARWGLLHPAAACRRCTQRRMGPFLRTRNFASLCWLASAAFGASPVSGILASCTSVSLLHSGAAPVPGILPGVVWVGSMMYCCWPCIGHFAALSGIARCAAVIGAAVFLGHVLFFRLLWRHRALINPRLSPVRDRHGRRA